MAVAAADAAYLHGRPCAAPSSLRCGRLDFESQAPRLLPLSRALPGQTYFRPQAPRGIKEASRRLRHQRQLERRPPRERLASWVPLLLLPGAAAAAVPARETVGITASPRSTNGSRASPPWEVYSRNGFKNSSPQTRATAPPLPLRPPLPGPPPVPPAPVAAAAPWLLLLREHHPPRRAHHPPPLNRRVRPGTTMPRWLPPPLPLLEEQRKHPMMMCGLTKLR